ncbi:HAMP domain-containing sensor histidine kinase [Mycolicibacterium sp. 120270]|uniref:sensor histidine kinase n=1 Tax=Mycolicibacterium sp. 120270 TaxID=3090600 RepID=UPI00299E9691|nr:HAMP domain-containing sensor histidine kinase [Mycolicibacterium sp. 120270]MDX1886675.1 HAMP domain-containing sensor histidine kinase [Mycolicibacterium sp. 120270]
MRRRRRWSWGISARSALVAATVVFVALTAAGGILAAALYRSMLSGIDSTAAARVADVAASLESGGAAGLDPGLLSTDERILAVQVITPDGTVVRRSSSAPDAPMVPIAEIGDGLHIGMPEHESPYGQIRFSAQTVDGPDGRYTVLVGEGSQVVFATVKAVVIALAVAAPIVVLVSAAITYVLVSRSLRSVDAIRTRVAEFSTSDLTERVPVPDKHDEISALAVTMNEMLARIEAGHSAQQRFVGDASHELRSPLTTIISALEVAVAHPELLNGELATTTLLPEAHRMQALVDDLLLLARADERALTIAQDDVDVDDLLGAEIERQSRETSLMIRADVTPTRVVGDTGGLSRMLRNLLDNAVRHAKSEVVVTLHACGEHAVLIVDDDGPGIAPDDRERVFDRFVRLDANRSRSAGGAGLGLAIVWEIVTAHQGTVTITDRPGGGARFTVQLPLAYAPDSRR